jgi:dihydrofolate reductase
MSTIVVQAFITLDGGVQASGGPDEGADEINKVVGEWETKTEALLLGRTTYEIFAGSWGVWDENAEGLDGELTRRYNRIPKYVASRTLTEVGWQNSHLLGPDVPAAVEKLRAEQSGEIRVWGSTKRPHRR